jgi:hypothetical protein
MKFGFAAAMVASLSLSVVSSPAASQTTNCAELRLQERSAVRELHATQIALLTFNYEYKKSQLEYSREVMISNCYNNADNMVSECITDTDVYFDEEFRMLENEKSALEAEISAAESALSDIQYQLVSDNCR